VLTSYRPTFRAFAFAALAGCGLDLAGQQFVGVGDSPHGAALSPPSVEAADATSLATRNGGAPDADPAFSQDASLAQPSAASPNVASPAPDSAPADANLPDADLSDAVAVQDGTPNDGAPDAADDAGTPCDRLTFCCKHLVAPVPAALLLCASGAQLADGGDAGACGSLLANLQGARFCP
jgi:hypothetical protein